MRGSNEVCADDPAEGVSSGMSVSGSQLKMILSPYMKDLPSAAGSANIPLALFDDVVFK